MKLNMIFESFKTLFPSKLKINSLSLLTRPVVNNTNEGVLREAEKKKRDKAANKITNTLENAADTASKNKVVVERLVDKQRKLTQLSTNFATRKARKLLTSMKLRSIYVMTRTREIRVYTFLTI